MAPRYAFAAFLAALSIGATVPATANDGFDAFWDKFVDAMQIDDRDMERRLTKFPLAIGTELYDSKQFSALADVLFDVDARVCLITGTPLKSAPEGGAVSYAVFCGQQAYVFDRSTGVWKLSAISVID